MAAQLSSLSGKVSITLNTLSSSQAYFCLSGLTEVNVLSVCTLKKKLLLLANLCHR